MLENLETPVEQDTEYFNIKTNYSGELVEEYADGIRVFDPESPAQLRPKLISANVKIQALTSELITWKERYSTERSRYFEKKNQVEDFLKENHEDLGRELTGATEQFARQTSVANVELRAFGFREIKLDDIFPNEEQAKVAQLAERINAQIVSSITLMFFHYYLII